MCKVTQAEGAGSVAFHTALIIITCIKHVIPVVSAYIYILLYVCARDLSLSIINRKASFCVLFNSISYIGKVFFL